jgi:hypothetical protein
MSPLESDNLINSEKTDSAIIINGSNNKLSANNLSFFVKNIL